VMNRLVKNLRAPFTETPENEPYRDVPQPGGVPYRTFCGT